MGAGNTSYYWAWLSGCWCSGLASFQKKEIHFQKKEEIALQKGRMTELEKQKKINLHLKEALESSRQKVLGLKQDMKDLQQEIRLMAAQRMCPTLQQYKEDIKLLKKQLEEHKNYERNSLIKE